VTTPCLACGHTQLTRQRRYRTKTRHGRALFDDTWLCDCQQCHLVQAVPAPSLDALEAYYAEDYRLGCCAGSDVADLRTFPKDNLYYYNRGRAAAALVQAHLRHAPQTILDIGAGYGHILDALGRTYPKARRMAIEFSDPCVAHLRALGVEVHRDPADVVLPRLEERFDVVVLSHVLEHLLDPPAMLRLIRDRLAPDGVFYVEVPHIPVDALQRHPDHVWAPRFDEPHLTFFSVETLRGALTTAGLHVVDCDTAGPPYRFISAWRYRLPTMRWFLQSLLPAPLFRFLRRQRVTQPLRVREQEEEFQARGGDRIWIRALAMAEPTPESR